MGRIKSRWEIQKNWQFIFPILGCLTLAFSALLFSWRICKRIISEETTIFYAMILVVSIVFYYLGLKFFLWCFKKLEHKWITDFRWEMIAIFLVFAVTGTSAARLATPLTHLIGFDAATTSGFVYWPIRILLIFPIYQILLVGYGWLFGQFKFFMLLRRRCSIE